MAQNPAPPPVASPVPPVAARHPKVLDLHGERRVDDYFWLREKENPAVIDYLKAENAYTAQVMAPHQGLQAALYAEMLARIKETDQNVPYRKGGYWYYSRTEQGKQYNIHCRRKGNLEAPEEIVLDLNELAEGHPFLSLGTYDISPDGNVLAYSLDFSGFRQYTLFFKRLDSGQVLPDRREKVTSVAWAADSRTLFYVVEDHAKRPARTYRHVLGQKRDVLLFDEKDELYAAYVYATRSGGYVVLASLSSETAEARVLDARQPAAKPALIEKRRFGHRYFVDHRGQAFFIRTNDTGRNFRLVTTPVAKPGQRHWQEVIAQRSDVMLEEVDLFADFYVAVERRNGLPQLRVAAYAGSDATAAHAVEFPEAVYSASPGVNEEFQATHYRLNYESLVTPDSVFDYDVRARTRKLLKQQPVLGGYDPAAYETRRIYAPASDGTRIPVSLVFRRDLRRAGPQPLLLYGYGAYGIPMDVGFRSTRLSLLDRGVVFAIAHIRGGGEMGKQWHDDGKMMQKKNTFADFIAAAEFLITEQYTAPDRLVIQGGSAGGLLMGAVVNLRPDLFKAVVSQVPFVDVITTMLDADLPLTVGEYLEWGNPNEKPAYDYLRTYSPYDNLQRREYPAMLVETSLNDSQVMYWEPAKYVAKLRTLKTDDRVLLLRTNLAAGHGGASGRYDYLKEIAATYTFVLTQLGLTK